jgi:hypothetical protein
MKKIAVFDDTDPNMFIENCTCIWVPNSRVIDFLETYGDSTDKPLKQMSKKEKVDCVVLHLGLGYDNFVNMGFCMAIIAHYERIPIVIYARKNVLIDYTMTVLSGVLKKVTKKQVIEVTDNDFSEVIVQIKKILEPANVPTSLQSEQ